jgi:hypothetical protein
MAIPLLQVLNLRGQEQHINQDRGENKHGRSVENAQRLQRGPHKKVVKLCYRKASQLKHETQTRLAKFIIFGF